MKTIYFFISLVFLSSCKEEDANNPSIVPLKIKSIKEALIENGEIIYTNYYIPYYDETWKLDSILELKNSKYVSTDSICYRVTTSTNKIELEPINNDIKNVIIYYDAIKINKIEYHLRYSLFPYNYEYNEIRKYFYTPSNKLLEVFSRMSGFSPLSSTYAEGIHNIRYEDKNIISYNSYSKDTNISYYSNYQDINTFISYSNSLDNLNELYISIPSLNNYLLSRINYVSGITYINPLIFLLSCNKNTYGIGNDKLIDEIRITGKYSDTPLNTKYKLNYEISNGRLTKIFQEVSTLNSYSPSKFEYYFEYY